eukprot:2232981-Amphidinium_carterae.1
MWWTCVRGTCHSDFRRFPMLRKPSNLSFRQFVLDVLLCSVDASEDIGGTFGSTKVSDPSKRHGFLKGVPRYQWVPLYGIRLPLLTEYLRSAFYWVRLSMRSQSSRHTAPIAIRLSPQNDTNKRT